MQRRAPFVIPLAYHAVYACDYRRPVDRDDVLVLFDQKVGNSRGVLRCGVSHGLDWRLLAPPDKNRRASIGDHHKAAVLGIGAFGSHD